MMHMTLYWGIKVTLLFDSWKTHSWPSYAFSLLACFLFSAFYQYMEDRRIRFKSLSSSSAAFNLPQPSSIDAPLLLRSKLLQFGPSKFSAAILFGVNSAIGYLLMLTIMSFNGGVFLAIVSGLSVGYLLFRSGDGEIVAADGDSDNPCACA